jgi:hypothetical protein
MTMIYERWRAFKINGLGDFWLAGRYQQWRQRDGN